MTPAQLLAGLTPQARDEPDSGIVAAAMYGMARTGVIPLWSGEGNVPTPAAFAQPAIDSLLRGETFYTWQRGIPELREALAAIDPVPAEDGVERVEVAVPVHQLLARPASPGPVI